MSNACELFKHVSCLLHHLVLALVHKAVEQQRVRRKLLCIVKQEMVLRSEILCPIGGLHKTHRGALPLALATLLAWPEI